ncbi:hypothetical protein BBJ28_00006156 [Nothophytophthora sp. Chile5]|nr:hypothetical protein BBJ28_00006156 [Nothophytophthora sp. Chile5]
MNLGPEKTEQMGLISDRLALEDINFFEHIFRQIDTGTNGLMGCGCQALTLLGITTTDKELDEYLLIADADGSPSLSVHRSSLAVNCCIPVTKLCVTAFGVVGSKAIDLQEWVMLCGMLVTPPHEEEDLMAAFHVRDIPVVVFRTKMQRILENAYAHLPECNQHEVSCYVDDILSALDPNNTECVDVQECIRILCTPYHARPAEDDELWRELADTSVECELCNEPYDEDDGVDGRIPRLLVCGHTFCQV